jgi:oligosaccharide repeat unit polymerase
MDYFNIWVITIVLLFVFSAFIFKLDVLSPSIDICAVFVLSTFLLSLYRNTWNVIFYGTTYLYLIIAIISIIVTEVFIVMIFRLRKSKYYAQQNLNNVPKTLETLNVNKFFVILIIAYDCFMTYFFYSQVARISNLGSDYSTSMISNYRYVTAYSDINLDETLMPTWINQGEKIVEVLAFILLYVFINNYLVKSKKKFWKDNILLLFPIFIYIAETILTGGRITIIQIFAYCFILFVTLKRKVVANKRSENFHDIKTAMKMTLVMFVVFFGLTPLIRVYNNRNFMEYIGVYLGAPLQLFNLYCNSPTSSSIFGEETFSKVYTSLYKLNLFPYAINAQLEARRSNGIDIGNVYTFFRRPLHDFGFFGMLVFTIIVIAIYCYFYYFIIKSERYKTYLPIIFYGYFYYLIALFSVDNIVVQIMQLGNIAKYLLFPMLYFFLFKIKIKFKF